MGTLWQNESQQNTYPTKFDKLPSYAQPIQSLREAHGDLALKPQQHCSPCELSVDDVMKKLKPVKGPDGQPIQGLYSLVSESDPAYQFVQQLKPKPNETIIASHAKSDALKVYTDGSHGSFCTVSPATLAAVMKKMGIVPPGQVTLNACLTGSDPNGFAAQLSQNLDGRGVNAPFGYAKVENGRTVSANYRQGTLGGTNVFG